jgi:hypothetical protein
MFLLFNTRICGLRIFLTSFLSSLDHLLCYLSCSVKLFFFFSLVFAGLTSPFVIYFFKEEAVSVATTDLGSVAGGEENSGRVPPKEDEDIFLRPRTPPRRRYDPPPVRPEEEGDPSEESDVDSGASATTTTSSFDDLSKDIEDKVRNS